MYVFLMNTMPARMGSLKGDVMMGLQQRLSTLMGAVVMGVAVFSSAQAAEQQPGVLKEEFIYETAPFPSCHASTIVETDTGLVTAWFAGKHEKNPDVGIWVSRQEDGKWTPPVEVANGIQYAGKRHPCWNPVLFQPKEGPLLLFYKVGRRQPMAARLGTNRDDSLRESMVRLKTNRFNWPMATSSVDRVPNTTAGVSILNERAT